jgi:hypothetical protein
MTEPTPHPLHAFLAGRDVSCPACGYNLRDLAGDRCPECGEALVLQVGVAEPRQAAAITGLIGLAAGAGMSALLLAYLLVQVAVYGRYFSSMDRFFAINFFGLVVEGTALALWLRYWRAVRRLSPNARWGLAAACWGLTAVYFVLFSMRVR